MMNIITQTPETVQRDDIFYVDTITFKVEDTLFCVPRWGFEHPECIFSAIFDLPAPRGDGKQIEGTSDECPIILEGESKAHFKAFLKVLYPCLYGAIPKVGESYSVNHRWPRPANDVSLQEWLGVLDLSTKWQFNEIRREAIQNVSERLPPDFSNWDKMALARKYHVGTWLLDEYRGLLLQREAHSVKGLRQHMEVSEVLTLLQIRENIFTHGCRECKIGCYYCGTELPDKSTVNKHILEAFASEFAYMQD